jgi:(p)ppGpp synthase/HD superfamily hydrolase
VSNVRVAVQIAARAPDLHPFIVAAKLARENEDELSAFVVGLLHDSIEDGYATDREIWENFSEQEYQAVQTLTRRTEETYAEYIHRIQESEDPLAIKVKRADAEVNLDRCLADADAKRAQRYAFVLENLHA